MDGERALRPPFRTCYKRAKAARKPMDNKPKRMVINVAKSIFASVDAGCFSLMSPLRIAFFESTQTLFQASFASSAE